MRIKSNLFKNLFELFSIMLGFFYVCFVLWNRLLRVRLSRELVGPYDSFRLCIYIILFCFCICMVIFYCRLILQIEVKPNSRLNRIFSHTYFQRFWIPFETYVLNAPYKFYDKVYNTVYLFYNHHILLRKISVKIWNTNICDKDKWFLKTIVILLYIIKFIILICFTLDILLLHQFHYFYKSLFLLIIPLLFRTFIFILKDASKDLKKYLEEKWLVITTTSDKTNFIVNFRDTYPGGRTESDLNFHSGAWFAYLVNCMFADNFYAVDNKYKNYVNAVYYSILTLGWAYIIIYT